MTRVFAAADIGSNTAHLLVAATDGSLVMRIDNYNEWISLGEVVARTGTIPKEQAQQLLSAVKEIKKLARARQVQCLYVFGTEALRIANNHLEIIKKISSETGVLVDLISPRREAELSLNGVNLDAKNVGANLLFEVGGGSAQIGTVEKGSLKDEESHPLGTGRIIAESGMENPCSEVALRTAENYIRSTLDRCQIQGSFGLAVASGGVARGLWRALHPDGEKYLTLEEIEYIAWASAKLNPDRLMMRFSVKARRAGTLLPGALVYRELMRRFDVKQIVISEFGIREGAILSMAAGEILGCPV